MFALRIDRFGPPEVLVVGEMPEPHARGAEVRIRVRAAGVSPVDLALRDGSSPSAARLVLPHIPGVDAAGIVDEVGPDARGVTIGDEVFGSVDITRLGGATAEFAVLAFSAPKPASMTWAEAGAAASGIETATRVLDLVPLHAGSTLLVEGAAGGVGSFVVQLAIARGATVIGTASAANQDFVHGLGATPVVYGPGLPQRVAEVGGAEFAIDAAGAHTLDDLIAVTGSADSVVTIADFGGPALGVTLSLGDFGGEPNGRHGLADAAALSQSGRFRVPLRESFSLDRAAEAHALAGSSPRRGKVAITIDDRVAAAVDAAARSDGA